MKILISSFTFFPQVSGIANVTIEHAKHFETEGHQVTIVTSSDRERSFTSIQNIEIIEFPTHELQRIGGSVGSPVFHTGVVFIRLLLKEMALSISEKFKNK